MLGAFCAEIVGVLAPDLSPQRVAIEGKRLFALVDGLALHVLSESRSTDTAWAVEILRDELARIAGTSSHYAGT